MEPWDRMSGVVKKDTIVMENGKNNPDHLLFLENVETGHEERQWGNMFIANIARKDWKPIKDFKGDKAERVTGLFAAVPKRKKRHE